MTRRVQSALDPQRADECVELIDALKFAGQSLTATVLNEDSETTFPRSLMHYFVLIRASSVYSCAGARYAVRHILQKYLAVFTIFHCLPYVRCRSSYSCPFVRPMKSCYIALSVIEHSCWLISALISMHCLRAPIPSSCSLSDHRCLHRLDKQLFLPTTLHLPDYSENGTWIHPQAFAVQQKQCVSTTSTWPWATNIDVVSQKKGSSSGILWKLKSISIIFISEFSSSADPTLVKRRSCSVFAILRSSPKSTIPRAKG